MTVDLQDLFDRAGRNPPDVGFDPDEVVRRVRRSRTRRAAIAVAATLAVAVAVVVAGERRMSADPVPASPAPTTRALGTLGRLAYGLNGDIYLADADGRNPVRIADGSPNVDNACGRYGGEGPLWSPDGRHLAYRGSVASGDAAATCGGTVNISDSTGRRVASFPGQGWRIAWSPDSTRVAVWSEFGEHLAIHGLDGARQALLDLPSGYDVGGDYDPVWSSDGASLLLPDGRGRPGAEIPVNGSPPKQLVGDPRSFFVAKPSPNGAKIAYFDADGLFIADPDGSKTRKVVVPDDGRIFNRVDSAIAWSPTGDRIAYVVVEVGGVRARELAVLDVASGRKVTLAEVGLDFGWAAVLEFSPEGDQILFTRTDAADKPSLWSIHTDGSGLRRLVVGTTFGGWQTVRATR
ncbi:MAG TPA: hypothetical protein VFJ97_16710 [Dermatophilaceae bacterium]|nr:hypothetical protein [Dermatophilaceae bacterium]